MQSCLKSCGDCASAKNFPGCRRTGTRKSRAPSGRAARHRGRPDVDEAELVHRAADAGDRGVRHPQVALHALAAHVEPAVAEPRRLLDGVVADLERQRRRARQDLQALDLDLDLARREVRVDGVRRARGDLADGLDDEFVAQLVAAVRLLEDELDLAGVVAQVDEDEPAVVAPGVDPAGDRQALPDVLDDVALRTGCRASSRRERSDDLCRDRPFHRAFPRGGSSRRRRARTTSVAAPVRAPCVSCPFTDRPAKSMSAARPARRSSCRSACATAGSPPSTTTNTSSGTGSRTTFSFSSASSSRSMPAPKPMPGRRRPADLLDEPVVAPAAADHRVRVLLRPHELERGARVVVEPAHERRIEDVRHAEPVEPCAHLVEVRAAVVAERVADLRRVVERLAQRRILHVEHLQRARRTLVQSLPRRAGRCARRAIRSAARRTRAGTRRRRSS